MFPQLKIASEYSFKRAYGKLSQIAARLKEIDCPAAGLVDLDSAWGHERWADALGDDVRPMYGVALPVPQIDGRAPIAWALARQRIGALYELASAAPEDRDWRSIGSELVRFAGAALSDPDAFDFVDVDITSRRHGLAAKRLAQWSGKPLVIVNANLFPAPEHEGVEAALWDNRRTTPGHILSLDELRKALGWLLSPGEFSAAVDATCRAAEESRAALLPAPGMQVDGDLDAEIERGLAKRIAAGMVWDQRYEARLQHERETIADKGFDGYFLVVGDMMRWAKNTRGILAGPARGSAAGSLVAYLLEITEVDPIAHDLLFERFLDINRGGWFFEDDWLDELEARINRAENC